MVLCKYICIITNYNYIQSDLDFNYTWGWSNKKAALILVWHKSGTFIIQFTDSDSALELSMDTLADFTFENLIGSV